jgi:hypothetical protein
MKRMSYLPQSRFILAFAAVASLSGCITTEDQRVLDWYFQQGYTRAQVDHLNAEAQCKLLARNLVQIERCKVR